jgi:hypothetical protein
MKSVLLRLLASVLLMAAARAQTPPSAVPMPPSPPLPTATLPPSNRPTPKKEEASQWVFSLLPKSFQQNPNLELTVITEMTEEGKKLPPVSSEHPAYYITQSSGYHQLGDSSGDKKIMTQAEVERILAKSLAANGYHPAQEPAQPPSLAIFYTWGTHNMLVEADADNPAFSAQQVARNLLDRAALVGGEKFAKQMLDLFLQADAMAQATNIPTPPDGQPIMSQDQLDFTNPVHQFKMQAPKNEFLVDQFADDVYYVVASAYDYKSLGAKQRKLMWRTRMTVAAKGVSQEQSMPTLIAAAAPYFGREMDEAETLVKHAVPEGKVEIGTATVVPPNSAPAPQPTKKP